MNVNNTNALTHIRQAVCMALKEDVGKGDVTAQLCDTKKIKARLISRESAILCGQQWVDETFRQLDETIRINWSCQDGDNIHPDQTICEITGNAPNVLTGERTALNFLQSLSGTATIANQYAQLLSDTHTKLLDTRKTIPGLRCAQKYAVTCGGGNNHRMGLYDAYLIKENHIAACGSINNAITKAKSLHPELTIEIEVETLAQLNLAIDCDADIALLDNFSLEEVTQAIAIAKGKISLEVSGGITLDNIKEYAQLGIDYVSVGALTKHVHAIDFSMLFE